MEVLSLQIYAMHACMCKYLQKWSYRDEAVDLLA